MSTVTINLNGINELDVTSSGTLTASLSSPGVVALNIGSGGGGGSQFSTMNIVTGSRSLSSTFTNANPTTIYVVVVLEFTGGAGDWELESLVNGSIIDSQSATSTVIGATTSNKFMVPPGGTYACNPIMLSGTPGLALSQWTEWV